MEPREHEREPEAGNTEEPAAVPGGRGQIVGPEGVPTGVAFRDLVIFQVKLALDGFGDLILSPLALLAFVFDLLPGRTRGKTFYAVLRFGERWDKWLSLYRPSTRAGKTKEGLLQAGQVDADTFLGKVEEVVRTAARKGPDREGP